MIRSISAFFTRNYNRILFSQGDRVAINLLPTQHGANQVGKKYTLAFKHTEAKQKSPSGLQRSPETWLAHIHSD